MLLLSLKAGPIYGPAYNVWKCAIPIRVVESPCVCHIVVPCMAGGGEGTQN